MHASRGQKQPTKREVANLSYVLPRVISAGCSILHCRNDLTHLTHIDDAREMIIYFFVATNPTARCLP
jgi:hypothetical protein